MCRTTSSSPLRWAAMRSATKASTSVIPDPLPRWARARTSCSKVTPGTSISPSARSLGRPELLHARVATDRPARLGAQHGERRGCRSGSAFRDGQGSICASHAAPRRAAVKHIDGRDGAVVRVQNFLADGQAQSGTAGAVLAAAGLHEGAEYPFQLGRRNAGAVVAHADAFTTVSMRPPAEWRSVNMACSFGWSRPRGRVSRHPFRRAGSLPRVRPARTPRAS